MLPVSVDVLLSEIFELSVDPITSLYPIGNTLDIAIRQKPGNTYLHWLILTQGNPANLKFDAQTAGLGTHILYIESFDKSSTV